MNVYMLISGGGGRPSQCPPLEESVVGYFLAGVDPRTLLPPVYGWQKKEGHGTFHHIHHDSGYHDLGIASNPGFLFRILSRSFPKLWDKIQNRKPGFKANLGVCGQLLRTPCLVQTADLTVVRMNSGSFHLTRAVGISSSLLGLDELSFSFLPVILFFYFLPVVILVWRMYSYWEF